MDLVDPRAGESREGREVDVARQPLGLEAPHLARARRAAQRMIAAARRASEVMDRIRGLLNKTPPERTRVDINDLLRETLAVMDAELRVRQIVVATELAEPSPVTIGDRVQLQQVILNLIMNGVEAMSPVADRPRRLRISSRREAPDSILVAVEDSGRGWIRRSPSTSSIPSSRRRPAGPASGSPPSTASSIKAAA